MKNSSIIEELYYGNISPCEKRFEKESNYAECMSVIVKNEKMLAAVLNESPESQENLKLFDELTEAKDEISGFERLDCFIDGFQLGSKFMPDTLVLPRSSVLRDIL